MAIVGWSGLRVAELFYYRNVSVISAASTPAGSAAAHYTSIPPLRVSRSYLLCCKQASSQCFLSEVKFNVKTQVKARIPQNVSLLHNCPVNHFRTNCDKVTFSCRRERKQTQNKRLRAQIRPISVLVLCPKVCVCPLCALVFCGLTSELRKMPLSPFHYSCW